MAHFAQIDENNIVLQVVVIANEDCQDENGNESEAVGVAFCKTVFGEDTNWAQTSYNGNMRYNYAGIGFTWDAENNAFYGPQPYPSWGLNEGYRWQPPIPMPEIPLLPDGEASGHYVWSEEDYTAEGDGWVFYAYDEKE
jgi:hypothetical protein